MNVRQTVVKNTLLQISLQFFNLLVGVYSISLIVRYLGKTAFGKYGFISSFYFFFLTFLDFGASVVALREVSREREKAGLFLANLVTFKFFISIILAFIAITIANIYPFPQDLRFAISFYSPILLFMALEFVQIIFEADLRYEYIVLASFLWRVASLLFVILAIWLNLDLVAIVISFVLAEIIKCLSLYVSSKKIIEIKLPVMDIKLWIKMIKSAIPIGITSILVTIIRNTDVVMLTKMKGFAEAGLYTASSRLCDISLSLPLALMGSVFPLMSKFYHQDFNYLKRLYQKTFDILSVSGVLLTVLVLALADKVIILLFGSDFIRSVVALRILIFSALFVYLAIGAGSLLIVTDRQRINMWLYTLAALLNIILNIVLIPRLSFIGAAISNVVAMLLVISLTFYFVGVKLGIPLKIIKLIKVIVVGLITFVILFCLREFNLFISIPIGILSYIFLLILAQAIDMEDIIFLFKRRIQGIG